MCETEAAGRSVFEGKLVGVMMGVEAGTARVVVENEDVGIEVRMTAVGLRSLARVLQATADELEGTGREGLRKVVAGPVVTTFREGEGIFDMLRARRQEVEARLEARLEAEAAPVDHVVGGEPLP
jgi:hypothetical protein